MGFEILFRYPYILGEDDLVYEVEIVSLYRYHISRVHGSRGEALEFYGFQIRQFRLGGYLGPICGHESQKTRFRAVFRHGYPDLARHPGLHYFYVCDRIHAGDDYTYHLVQIASQEAKDTSAHYRLGPVYVQSDTVIGILVGAEFLFLAACKQHNTCCKQCRYIYYSFLFL